MKKASINVIIAIDVLLYLATASLGYFSAVQQWAWFFGVLVVSLFLFFGGQITKYTPIRKRIEEIHRKQNELSFIAKRCGILNIFDMSDRGDLNKRNSHNRQMIRESMSMYLLAESANSYIDPSVRLHWDDLKDRLDNGASFKLLIINPFSPAKKIRNKINGVVTKIDPKFKFDRIVNLKKKYPNVEIRFTDEVYCSLFITDKEVIYDPYHLGKLNDRVENYFIALHLSAKNSNGDNHYYRILKAHFDALWIDAISFSDFISLHKDEISGTGYSELVGSIDET